MFIPLEGDNILCLAEVVAIYRDDGDTIILRCDGSKEKTCFTPATLAKRAAAFSEQTKINGRSFS